MQMPPRSACLARDSLRAGNQKHCPLQKLFDNRWLHLIVLDIRTDQFVRYESQGQWAPVSIRQPALLSLSRISQ